MESRIDFVKAGKESYYIVTKFEHFEVCQVAPHFRRMSQAFSAKAFLRGKIGRSFHAK